MSTYGNLGDWSKILGGAGSGASSAMQGVAQAGNVKRETREAKRRNLANLLSQSLKRGQGLSKVGQEYGGEMSDFQSQAMQQIARGFADSLKGITGG